MLNYVTDRLFRVDDAGNTLFYPYGSAGKGYIVPSKNIEKNIRNFAAAWYVCCFVMMGLCFLSGHIWWVWFLALAALIIWELRIRAFKRVLMTSPVELTFSESIRSYAAFRGRLWITLTALLSFVVAISSVYMFIDQPSILSGMAMLFFVVMAVLQGYILSLKVP
jgi:hypothetical protein